MYYLPKMPALFGIALLLLSATAGQAQTLDSVADKTLNFPSRLLSRLQGRTASLNQQLTRQTERYLKKMARQERKAQERMARVDSVAAKNLFAASAQRYAILAQRMRWDTGSRQQAFTGVYQPYLDSMQGSIAFLRQNPQLLGKSGAGPSPQLLMQLQTAGAQLQMLQAKMKIADGIKSYVQQRQQQMAAYVTQHANLQGTLGKSYAVMNRNVYYYSQQLRQYQEMWNNPGKLEQNTLAILNRLPAFQSFMKNNSQLSGLFHVPGNYGTPQALNGLQTKDDVARQVQNKVSAGGPGGGQALQTKLQSAQSQLDGYKTKLNALGAGNGDMAMPDFKPNDQKTKTFWRRLEYGANIQTIRNNYMFPTVTDFGGSLAYKLGHKNLVGIGASYKLGWGNGINHIAFSSQGVGLRSFLQIKIKASFSATGGFEYNYATPFTSYQQLKQLQYWTRSGLVGVTKTVSVKSRVFKKTSLSLLWDFLSYQQIPKTQAVLFRIGYSF